MRSLMLFAVACTAVAMPIVRPARADAPDPAAAALRSRATEWLEVRRKLDDERCEKCEGTRYRYDSKTREYQPCTACEGHGRQLAKARYFRAYYDLRSPAWRARDTSLAETETAYAATRWKRAPGFVRRFKIDRVTLLDPTHGVVFVLIDSDRLPTETRWITTSPGSGKSDDWYLYSPESDGKWPENAMATLAAAQVQQLPDEQIDALRAKLIVGRRSPFALETAQREGDALVLSLYNGKATTVEGLDGSIEEAILPFTADALEAQPGVDRVKLAFASRYRDSFGQVAKGAYRTFEISREDFGRLRPENLSRDELLKRFAPTNAVPPEGSILWWKD